MADTLVRQHLRQGHTVRQHTRHVLQNKNWNTYSNGGKMKGPGKHTYDIKGPWGEYHISAATTRYGRHLGYTVSHADTHKLLSDWSKGLWSAIGEGGVGSTFGASKIASTPAQAMQWARDHYDKIIAPRLKS